MSARGMRVYERPAIDGPPLGPAWDITRILLAVAGIGGLIAATFWILRPFLPAMLWATMIVVATWPMLLRVQARLWGRRSLAVTIMTLLMLAILALPLTLTITTFVDRIDDIVAWSRSIVAGPLPPLPEWVARVPLLGKRVVTEWESLARAPSEALGGRLSAHLRDITRWLLVQAGSMGFLILQFLLTVAMSALLYARGEVVGRGAIAFSRRLAGEEGVRALMLSAGAIRAVALGIVVTALVQAAIGGIGLVVTGVPRPLLFTCVMLVLGIAQIGPAPVMAGALIYLYATGHPYAALVLLAWGLVTMSLDNVLRPVLIKRGADLPLLLIIAGVIGGLIAFGLVGLFVGPVILAVAYTLLLAWVQSGAAPADPVPSHAAVES